MQRVIRIMALLASLVAPVATAVAERPTGYPRSYDQLIAAARAERQVIVYANADTSEMAPVIVAFQRRYPGVTVRYTDLGSNEMYRRFVAETRARKASADLVWSSAMDQQVKLINDGFAQAYASPEKPALPASAVWKNMGYGITAEPIAYVYNKKAVPNPPRSHAALETMLRRDRRALMGKVATFDPARSNTGYLYLTQDYAITRDTQSLVEAMAATRPVLATTTEPMLRGVAEGRLAIAYNVIGSYALERARRDPRIGVVFPQDYTIILSRIAFIAREARHPAGAKLFLDFLLSRQGQSLLARHSLWPARTDIRARRLPAAQARPVRVGPQLLVNLDRLKQQRFLRQWRETLASGAR
ncbi:ABC transporter substrate-binding protein [Sphingobium lactosutens]|uniref:Iron ABC transporter substrate-binding protein n=1 Tax=Sphingobium lactosutens DS20 TaxID=1331060 RepID=T0IWM9_9SPHN|nr:ABC transporter substrate-binding protein [Sphingobium lactosutens]EQB14119.1 iron ABC transporter substrate-binding protein [Sphingobium lactosutens DS20]